MVQLYLNNELCDLYGKETIATDYSIAPISDISSRTSAKSISFKIPLTANNRAIIENANVIVNSTTLPYTLIPAKLKANGLPQGIEFAAIESIKDTINIRLFGSNIDFFSIIKGRKLEDLSDTFDHAWTLQNAYDSRDNTEGYIYALIDFHADSPNGYINNTDPEIDVRGLLPSVFLHSLISQIITDAGFTAQGDFLQEADYRSVIIPCLGIDIGRYADSAALLASAESSNNTGPGNNVVFDVPINDPLGLIAGTQLTIPMPGTFRVEANFSFPSGGIGISHFELKLNGVVVDDDFFMGAGSTTLVYDGQLTGASVFTLHNNGTSVVDILAGATIAITEASDIEQTGYGFYYDVLANLPDLKQSDLLKDTAQKFGLIFQVDNQNKVVKIRRFSEVLDNITNALDWSDKVDYTEKPELKFNSDYAQRNLCIYSEDDTVIKPVGTDSEILIDNQNLEAEKELFESPFAASEQVERFNGVSIAQIKIFTDLGGADEEIAEVEPRYLVKRTEAFSVFTYTDGTDTEVGTDVPVTHFILEGQDFNAGFQNNLLDNSADLIALIQEFKQVTILLRLTAADINQLDFFIPVWIELNGQPGCYYYISKISQFKVTSKESTEVELVKLNT